MNIISVLVVLYNKSISESQTLLSFLNIQSGIVDNLCIWNNGPLEIEEDDAYFQLKQLITNVYISNELSNKPLSKVYNLFINNHCDSNYFVILDDDSILENSYLSVLNLLKLKNNIDLILPKIKQNGIVHYPLVNFEPMTHKVLLTKNNCLSIGSGLIFNKSLVDEYYKNFHRKVFDENFALYGVDTSFFFRLAKVNREFIVKSSGEIVHSLSRLHKQDKNESKFRTYERAIDVALCARHYPMIQTYRPFIRYLGRALLINNSFPLFFLMLKSYFLGKHFKC